MFSSLPVALGPSYSTIGKKNWISFGLVGIRPIVDVERSISVVGYIVGVGYIQLVESPRCTWGDGGIHNTFADF